MRAIVLEKFGGLDSLVYKDIPEPEPKAGYVVIEIKAFGINYAEMHMRRGEVVKSCPGGEFPIGAKVAALMGVSAAPSTAATQNTRARRSRTLRSSNPICRGRNWPRSLKPTRLRGPACSATWKSRGAKFW